MAEPVTLVALGVAIGKLLLRWSDLNDTADAVEDARAGFGALRALGAAKATDPVGTAITGLLEKQLTGVRDQGRRGELKIAVANVADLFANLTDDDIRAAAQHPDGFPDYLARGPGGSLLANTEEALTPFTRRLIAAGAEVFAELAPRSGRFTPAALIYLLNQVDGTRTGVRDLQSSMAAARADLAEAANRVDELHPKVDALLQATTRQAGAVAASREATRQGVTLGRLVPEWDPEQLGVHASITVHDERNLTPYLTRAHDHQLRDHLAVAKESDQPTLLLVVGTSCTGKTRTLYEAIHAVLPNWQLTAPSNDTALANFLLKGVPAQTIVWLDELQDRLTRTPDGITAAKAITDLLTAEHLGPIVFAGTLWPVNLTELRARPDPATAGTGAGAITDLLKNAVIVDVPDAFTDDDLEAEDGGLQDARLRKAIDTATQTDHPEHGRKIIQLLAGGTQLLNRLYPPAGTHKGEPFTPIATAVLHAAADLRRIGLPNPLPRWAIEGAAPRYLHPPDLRPPAHWLAAALEETTRAARHDDPLTGTRSHDIHGLGVPALTPRWDGYHGNLVECYDLHEYLLEAHTTTHSAVPARHVVEQLCDARLAVPLHLGGVRVLGEAVMKDVELAGRIGRALSQPKQSDEFAAQLAEYLYNQAQGVKSLKALACSGANPVARSLVATIEGVVTSPPDDWPRVDFAIIDDHALIVEALTTLLHSRWPNAVVSRAHSVESFLRHPASPRVVIMDLHRPEVLNGARGVRVVVASRDASVIVLSQERRAETLRAAHEAGAAMVLPKTIAAEELLDAVGQLAAE